MTGTFYWGFECCASAFCTSVHLNDILICWIATNTRLFTLKHAELNWKTCFGLFWGNMLRRFQLGDCLNLRCELSVAAAVPLLHSHTNSANPVTAVSWPWSYCRITHALSMETWFRCSSLPGKLLTVTWTVLFPSPCFLLSLLNQIRTALWVQFNANKNIATAILSVTTGIINVIYGLSSCSKSLAWSWTTKVLYPWREHLR